MSPLSFGVFVSKSLSPGNTRKKSCLKNTVRDVDQATHVFPLFSEQLCSPWGSRVCRGSSYS